MFDEISKNKNKKHSKNLELVVKMCVHHQNEESS